MSPEEDGIEEVDAKSSISKKIMDDLGFMNEDQFYDFCLSAISGMEEFGSPFDRALGHALDMALDSDYMNKAVRLIYSFRMEFEHYSMLYRMQQAVHKATTIA
jgi:hypothetical protein